MVVGVIMEYEEPEWTVENRNREEGDTTFEICGWCEHRGCGSFRYHCMLSGHCSLIKSYGDNVVWNTPCVVKILGKLDINDLIDGHNSEIEGAKSRIKRETEIIKILKKIQKDAVESPPLPGSRDYDYYNIGDRIYVNHENKWEPGTVVNGYRHQDGCVSFGLDNVPGSNGWGCGTAVGGVLKEWEYDYFASNPERYKIWKEKVESERKEKLPNIPVKA
jgi:hypothetical protein